MFNACRGDQLPNGCESEIYRSLSGGLLWGGVSENYRDGLKVWGVDRILIRVTATPGRAGKQMLVVDGKRVVPVVELAPDSPGELITTLAHELVHVKNSGQHQDLLKDSEKLSGCLTRYQLESLRDEGRAFRAEIKFWESAPSWFKTLPWPTKPSRLLGGEFSAHEYYLKLQEKINEDALYIEKRYVELGEYPKCALNLISSARP